MTIWRPVLAVALAVWFGALAGRAATQTSPAEPPWPIPANAAEERNPLAVTEAVLTAGLKVFSSKCIRCHGLQGLGDGPDADGAHRTHMDLTAPDRAALNPDGVVFFKVWNGRSSPHMPRFADELSREQAWAVVTYVQALRKPR